MAKPFQSPLFLLLFIISLQTHFSNQLPESQLQAFFTIQRILNYSLSINNLDQNIDVCSIEPNPSLTIVCYEENITQIHTQGFIGFPPRNNSVEALFAAFAALPGLKVLSLVSLGLWGPLPQNIGNLTSLEMLNLSSNHLNGTIPLEILGLRNLQTIVLDHNKFTGEVPFWIGSLYELTVLSLKNNSLSGTLPSSISKLGNLRILQLAMNNFSGEVPDLSNLTNLLVLDMGNNSFGPKFPSLHNKLVTLVLKKNNFRFGMTNNFSSFYQLKKLDVSSNEFVETFLPSLLSLPLIGYINIAGNKFHGMLHRNMSCGTDLNYVDLSFNYLTGNLPDCLKSGNQSRIVHIRGNCFWKEKNRQHPQTFCHNEALAVKIMPHRNKGNDSGSKVVVAMSIVGATSLAGLLVLGVGFVVSKHAFKKPHTRVILEKATTMYPSKLHLDAREICQMAKLGPLGLPAYRNFLLDEIKEATANFDKSNLIGEGSYGPVYMGRLANDNLVVIRCLKVRKRRGTQAYTHDIELLSKLRHVHLVSALGHCFECNTEDSTISRIFLVFEFVPNGTLRDFILGQKPTWSNRITVAVEVAKGIQFLQTGMMPGLYSNNIKTTNVLVDHSLHVKLNSYNLPLLAEIKDKVNTLPACGTKENDKAIVKQEEKSDVYDFGVILLEIISGRAITSDNEASVVKDLFEVGIKADKIARKQILDPAMHKMCSDNSVKILMELCVRLLSNNDNDRPSIEDILWNLHFAAQLHDSYQGESSSDISTSPVFTSQ